MDVRVDMDLSIVLAYSLIKTIARKFPGLTRGTRQACATRTPCRVSQLIAALDIGYGYLFMTAVPRACTRGRIQLWRRKSLEQHKDMGKIIMSLHICISLASFAFCNLFCASAMLLQSVLTENSHNSPLLMTVEAI